jgi:hypothetical protein
MFDACGLDEHEGFVGQFARLAPIFADCGFDRGYAFPNLNHATGALIAVRQRPARVETDQARLLAQPWVALLEREFPKFRLFASNDSATVDAHYHLTTSTTSAQQDASDPATLRDFGSMRN